MATVYITEFKGAGRAAASRDGIPVAQQPPVAGYTVALTTTATMSTWAPGAGVNFVRVNTDQTCSFLFSSSTAGLATTTNARLPANATEYFGVSTDYRFSVISNS